METRYNMKTKYIFLDLDGTLIDHDSNEIPESTIKALKLAQEKGHELFICTGRIPSLFEDVKHRLDIHNYVAANGKLVVLHDEIIRNEFMTESYVSEFVDYISKRNIDMAFESFDAYVLSSRTSKITEDFLDAFHLEVSEVISDYYKHNRIYQINLMYNGDYKEFEEKFPHFKFSQANEFGLDVIEGEGMKEQGVRAVIEKLGIDIKDTFAFGDGYNDLSMIKYVNTGVAMGNANQQLKEIADYVTDDVTNDGIYKAFKKLNII